MKISTILTATAFLSLAACSSLGQAGDACTTDADCEEGLECHVHEHDEEEEGEEHEGEEEGGVCEAHEEGDEE